MTHGSYKNLCFSISKYPPQKRTHLNQLCPKCEDAQFDLKHDINLILHVAIIGLIGSQYSCRSFFLSISESVQLHV